MSIGAYSVIGAKVKIAKGVKIGIGCTIDKDCVIGKNTLLYDNVRLYENTQVGANCIFHSGVVLGADGFGFLLMEGIQQKIPQVGNVVIHDNVEIGANSCIDRATLGSTVLAKAQRSIISCRSDIIAPLASIASSVQVGLPAAPSWRLWYLAGKWALRGISPSAQSAMGVRSGLASSVPEGARYFGTPAMNANLGKRIAVAQKYSAGDVESISQRIEREER